MAITEPQPPKFSNENVQNDENYLQCQRPTKTNIEKRRKTNQISITINGWMDVVYYK